jgi:hypothetical protein
MTQHECVSVCRDIVSFLVCLPVAMVGAEYTGLAKLWAEHVARGTWHVARMGNREIPMGFG